VIGLEIHESEPFTNVKVEIPEAETEPVPSPPDEATRRLPEAIVVPPLWELRAFNRTPAVPETSTDPDPLRLLERV
jgi:hypothetical protein